MAAAASNHEQSAPFSMLPPLDAALRYAGLGWPVLAVHSARAGRCSCVNPQCEHPGKHPRTGHGLSDATCDEAPIRAWWARWPDANVGIALAPAGLCAIDVDPRNLGDRDSLPGHADTLTARTGGGGWHLLFRVPEGAVLPGTLGPGIDVKHNGYILAEPSVHVSGRPYLWLDWDVRAELPVIADAPEWLLKVVPPPGGTTGPEGRVRRGGRNETLSREAFRLRKKGLDPAAIFEVLLGLNQAMCDPPLEEEELRTIARGKAQVRPEPADGGHAGSPGGEPGNGGALPERYSEVAMADEYVARHGMDLRFVAEQARWLEWDGQKWVADRTMRGFDLARAIAKDYSARARNDGSLGKNPDGVARMLASSRTVGGIEKLARADRRVATTLDRFDAEPWHLNTPAGLCDMRTGKVRSHQRDDFCTRITAVAPDFTADCPIFKRFLREITFDDEQLVDFLQVTLGYCLTADTSLHALFFWHGTGRNGKNTLGDLVQFIAGDYSRKIPTSTLLSDLHGNRHPTEIANLRGVRLAVASDAELSTTYLPTSEQ